MFTSEANLRWVNESPWHLDHLRSGLRQLTFLIASWLGATQSAHTGSPNVLPMLPYDSNTGSWAAEHNWYSLRSGSALIKFKRPRVGTVYSSSRKKQESQGGNHHLSRKYSCVKHHKLRLPFETQYHLGIMKGDPKAPRICAQTPGRWSYVSNLEGLKWYQAKVRCPQNPTEMT